MIFRNLLRIKLLLLNLILGCFCCTAQVAGTYFHDLIIDGVPFNKEVNVLFNDSLGFLWIGTNNGLYRYDGHALTTHRYDVFDENSIPNNTINSIVEDDNQNLWIGSESYLIFFDRQQLAFKGFYKNSIQQILGKSSTGEIWFNQRNNNLLKVIPHKNSDSIQFDVQYQYEGNISPLNNKRSMNSFIEDNYGRYWFATNDGIFAFGDEKRQDGESFSENTLLLEKGANDTFFALTEEGFYVLGYHNGDKILHILEAYPKYLGNKGTIPTTLSIDPKDGTLYIGTSDGLVKGHRTDNRYVFNFFASDSDRKGGLRNNQINALTHDHYGNLWIGSHKGINKYIGRNSIFDFYKLDPPSISGNSPTSSLFIDNDKNVYAGVSDDGLYRIKGQTISKLLSTNDGFNVIKADHQNKQLLIGTGQTLLKSRYLDTSDDTVVFDTLKNYKSTVMDVVSTDQNETWVGLWAEGGIDILASGNEISDFKKNAIEQIAGNNVSVLFLDREQNMWVGTRGNGLYKIDINHEELYHFAPIQTAGLSSNAILSLLEVDDTIWIGTRGGGLNVYDKTSGTFTWFGEEQGLRSTTISSLQQDKDGNIWLSTQNGLARFDIQQKRFVNFGIEDGVMESQFLFNSSAADLGDGSIYFGCANGYYIVDSANFQQSATAPQTVITSLRTLGAEKDGDGNQQGANRPSDFPLLSDKKLKLPYTKNNIAIEFSSLDLTAPNKNEYAYMMEGINDYWVYTTASNRNANYNDLPPGNYTFKVKSSNSDGLWNENPTTLAFTIAPPFWRSNLAYLAYALFLLLSVWVAIVLIRRWYLLKKKLVAESVSRQKDNEHNRMKLVFFTDISHELRTPLTLIQGTIEKIMRQKQFAIAPLTVKRLHNNSLRIGRLIKQIMDIRKFDEGEFKIKVAKGNIVSDMLKIKGAFNDYAEIYQINYDIKTKQKLIKAWYDTEILEKIMFNLLSNAFKYTAAEGEIQIHMEEITLDKNNLLTNGLRLGKYMKCSVRDNGVGISKKDLEFIFDRYYQSTKLPNHQVPGTGIGMELVQKLIHRHHGRISVESEENVFTEFTFLLPIQRKHYQDSEVDTKKVSQRKEALVSYEIPMLKSMEASFSEIVEIQNPKLPRILLVEDNIEVRTMLKEELASDFCISEASNGIEGYAMATNQQPHLIISDILMPIEDGISFLKRLKKNKNVNHIPVIMLTARDSLETKIECLSMGADDFIEKPFSLEYVKWKVANILSTRIQLQEKYSKVITTEPSKVAVESKDEKFIKKLIYIVENSIDDDLLSVEFLASEVGMSRANLYRKLQVILNETPVNFIKHIRLKRAAQLLRDSDMYISEVAYRTGFNDQKYFSKCFSKVFGMSPTDYAKQNLKVVELKNNLQPVFTRNT